MNHASGALTPRFLAILPVLLLMTILFLLHAHLGGTPTLAQSTESILDFNWSILDFTQEATTQKGASTLADERSFLLRVRLVIMRHNARSFL